MALVSRARSSEHTPYRVTFAVLALAGLAYGLLSLVTPALPARMNSTLPRARPLGC